MCGGGGKNKGGGRETDADTEISSSRNSRAPGSPVESQPHPEGAGTGMGGGGGGYYTAQTYSFCPRQKYSIFNTFPFCFSRTRWAPVLYKPAFAMHGWMAKPKKQEE